MTSDFSFDIRYTMASDIDFLTSWFEKREELDNFFFNESEKKGALKNWIGFSKYKASLSAVFQGSPVAVGTLFLMPYKKVSHRCPFYLMVDPNYRNMGIGKSMVKNLLNLAKERFGLESLYVELIEGSNLISIVKKEGFNKIVHQNNFIKVGGQQKARMIWEHSFV